MLSTAEMHQHVDMFNIEAATLQREADIYPSDCLQAAVSPSVDITVTGNYEFRRTPVELWIWGFAQGVFLTPLDDHDIFGHLPELSKTHPDTGKVIRSVSKLAIASPGWSREQAINLGKGFDYMLAGSPSFGLELIADGVFSFMDAEKLPEDVMGVLDSKIEQAKLTYRQQQHGIRIRVLADNHPDFMTIQ